MRIVCAPLYHGDGGRAVGRTVVVGAPLAPQMAELRRRTDRRDGGAAEENRPIVHATVAPAKKKSQPKKNRLMTADERKYSGG